MLPDSPLPVDVSDVVLLLRRRMVAVVPSSGHGTELLPPAQLLHLLPDRHRVEPQAVAGSDPVDDLLGPTDFATGEQPTYGFGDYPGKTRPMSIYHFYWNAHWAEMG